MQMCARAAGSSWTSTSCWHRCPALLVRPRRPWLHRPDVLMVPVGDRFTMGAERAAFAVKRFFKPKAVIPCHFGSFPIIAPNADAFVAAMEGSGVQVITPHVGTAVTIRAS